MEHLAAFSPVGCSKQPAASMQPRNASHSAFSAHAVSSGSQVRCPGEPAKMQPAQAPGGTPESRLMGPPSPLRGLTSMGWTSRQAPKAQPSAPHIRMPITLTLAELISSSSGQTAVEIYVGAGLGGSRPCAIDARSVFALSADRIGCLGESVAVRLHSLLVPHAFHAAVIAGALSMCSARGSLAEGDDVPAGVQAQLIARVPAYDYEFRQRAGSRVRVFVLSNPNQPESVRAATLLHGALQREKAIAGLPHDVEIARFTDTRALADRVRERSVSIVYLTPGLDVTLDAICAALRPFSVMTFAAIPDYVRRCSIVGFQFSGGKPKILVNLQQAKESRIRFRSELLALAKVYR
jgi:hypothetical protein